MVKLVFIAFFLLAVQGGLTYFQFCNYRNTIRRLRNKGIIGIGVQKGKLKAGRIVVLVCDKMGKIIAGEEMHGITIFSRFKVIDGIKGEDIYKLKEKFIFEKNKNTAIIDAIEKMESALIKETSIMEQV